MNTLSLAALALLALAPVAQAANLITNGEFTQLSNGVGQFDTNTTVTGWSGNGGYDFAVTSADVGSNGVYGRTSYWDAANGGSNTWDGAAAGPGNFAAMDGDFNVAAITQSVAGLTVGKTYDLTFNYAFSQQTGFSGATVQSLDASIGGATWNSGDFNVGNHGFTGWQSESLAFTATSVTETLSFLAHGNLPVPPFALVSNVAIPSAVPEPASWALMIAGVGGLGAMARRRRVAVAA